MIKKIKLLFDQILFSTKPYPITADEKKSIETQLFSNTGELYCDGCCQKLDSDKKANVVRIASMKNGKRLEVFCECNCGASLIVLLEAA